MSKVIKIRKGLDIRLKGAPDKKISPAERSGLYAIRPTDFRGFDPRVLVHAGDEVLAGTPLICDKAHPEVVLVSPVSGTVEEVRRGERRKLLDVIVRENGIGGSVSLQKGDPSAMGADAVKKQILASGLWPAIIQRPYGVVAKPVDTPRDIFISAFDSAPLAADQEFILSAEQEAFATGLRALATLTAGKVHLGIRPGAGTWLSNLKGVETNEFAGPHPAGNVGIQIHHIAPVNKGEVVWTVNPQMVVLIGRTFLTGKPDSSWTFALAGSCVRNPQYFKGIMGMSLDSVIKGRLKDGQLPPRIISGNVLTGETAGEDAFLGYYDSVVSVIPEGQYFDLFGWAMPGMNKFSASRTFLSALFPKKEWDIDTNLKGGHRAFVMTGQYEKVFPMDIYPVYLLKAALTEDIDKMEQLGIYEVIEEDMALCEFVCTSKMDVQQILRSGLDLVRKEMS